MPYYSSAAISGLANKPAAFISSTALAPSVAGAPTNTEVTNFAIANGLSSQHAYYTGTVVSTDPITYVWALDASSLALKVEGGGASNVDSSRITNLEATTSVLGNAVIQSQSDIVAIAAIANVNGTKTNANTAAVNANTALVTGMSATVGANTALINQASLDVAAVAAVTTKIFAPTIDRTVEAGVIYERSFYLRDAISGNVSADVLDETIGPATFHFTGTGSRVWFDDAMGHYYAQDINQRIAWRVASTGEIAMGYLKTGASILESRLTPWENPAVWIKES